MTEDQNFTLFVGVRFRTTTPLGAATSLADLAESSIKEGAAVHLLNTYSLSLLDIDSEYEKVIQESNWNFPDGKPIQALTSFCGRKLTQIRGPQLFRDLLRMSEERLIPTYFLGGTELGIHALIKVVKTLHPNLPIAGFESPPFRTLTQEEYNEQDARIRKSGARIVWVGLGTPKQDFESNRIAASIPVVAISIGAAFDFLSGGISEAPKWIRDLGLEWLFRFASEPRRLWSRYTVGTVRFIRRYARRSREAT